MPISLQQRILCVALFLVSALIVLLHSSNYFSSAHYSVHHHHGLDETIDDHGLSSKRRSISSSSTTSVPFCTDEVAVLSDLSHDAPFRSPFRPADIEAQLKKFDAHQPAGAAAVSSDNSVMPSEEELQAARDNWIRPFLPSDGIFERIADTKTTKENRFRVLKSIWQESESYIAKRTGSNAPVVLFALLGGTQQPQAEETEADADDEILSSLPMVYHKSQENATVLVATASSRIQPSSSRRVLHFAPPSSSSAGARRNSWLISTKDVKSDFGFFFQSCNFVAQTFVLSSATASSRRDSDAIVKTIVAALPMSMYVFALVNEGELSRIEDYLRRRQSGSQQQPQQQLLRVKIERLLCVPSDHCEKDKTNKCNPPLLFVALHVIESERACSKTWGAPLVQWGRKLIAARSAASGIRFRVQAVNEGAKGAGRHVHPLQYIPSVNLDTLLGAGLQKSARRRLLADMVRTPRYSDPLPHNWVVGRGGSAIRIDRVDHRYDRDVDESKGYWGESTRGYFHLLGHHLCLDIDPNQGLPAEMTRRMECFDTCVPKCAAACSYTQKGAVPCRACLRCAACIEADEKQNDEAVGGRGGGGGEERNYCHVEYSSMHAARKIWSRWKKMDEKHGHKS